MKLKNIYSLFLILATLLCSGNVWGAAAYYVVDGIRYYGSTATTKSVQVTALSSGKYAGDVVIPSTFQYNSYTYTVTGIKDDAFTSCPALTSVTIEEGPTTIGQQAFSGCSSLTAVNLPSTITSVSYYAFYNCSSLNSITFAGSTPPSTVYDFTSSWSSFYNCASDLVIYVPEDAVDAYKTKLKTDAIQAISSETSSCAKPKNLTKSDDTPEGASFTWGQNTDETTYQWSCVASGTEVISWNTLDANVRTKTVIGLTAGTAYDFHVRSYCGDGEGEQSASAKITFTPTCPAPTAPVVSGISATGATLSWTAAAGITDYQYCVVNAGSAANWENAILVEGATSAPLSGLTASTNYDVYVRSYYSATTQSTAVKASFQTACGAVTIPYEWDFATIGCWTTHNCHSSSGISSGAYRFHWADPGQYLISPEFDAISGTVDVTFDYKVQGSSYPETFALGYSTTTNDVASFTWLPDETVTNTSYVQYAKTLPAGVKYIAIQCKSDQQYYLYIDNFSIAETPACPAPTITASNVIYNAATINCAGGSTENKWKLQYKAAGDTDWTDANGGNLIAAASFDLSGLTPGTAYQAQAQAECEGAWSTAVSFTPNYVAPTGLTVTEATTTTATISWTANSGEAAWTIQYKKSGDADWTTVENVTANPYTLTGLTSGSSYQVKVAAGALYTAAVDFNTECEAKTIPFEENFDALNCWSMQNQVSNTGLYNNMFRFYYGYSDQYLISPELVASANQVQVEFEYYVYLGTETFHVGYSTTTNEISAFTWGDEIAATNTSALTYSETFPANVKYIAIKYTSYDKYYLYIDNFSVTEYVAPSCAAPTALTVTDITTTSASVSWTSEAASFALEYKKTSDEDWTAATGTIASPFALEGLTANETEYTVRVKAICGENNESEWVELAAPFKTDCAVKTVTEETAWTEDFEAQTADQAPACWYLPTANDSYYYAKVVATEAKESAQCLDIKTYGTSSEIIVLPEFNEPVEHLNISFDYKNVNTGSRYGYLEVGYYSGSTFTRVGEALSKVENYTASGVIEMPKTDVPAGARIAFRLVGVYSSYNSHAYIDNLSVIRKPACAVPTNLQAVATSTGATLTWTAGDEETQWNVRYSVKDADTWTVLENKTSGFAITGLEVGTTYEVQVQAYCDENHQSAWTASVDFTPVCGAAPTALTVSARSTNAATLTWEGAEEAFKLQTSLDGETWEDAVDVNAKTYELTSLTAGTTYYARVQNACGGEYATTSFTTWCDAKDAAELPLNIESFTAVPECWEINFEGEYSGIANNKIYFYGEAEQMAVLPAYDIELNKLSVTFGFSTNNASLEFGYLDEPNGAFHAFASQPATGVELNLENEAAAVKYIAIRYSSTSAYASGSISSVLVRKTPTCAKPVDVTATPAVGAATIDWTSEAAAWNLQYKLASAANWTDAEGTITNPYALSGLEQGVTYKVRVQANCGEELSDWSDEASFTTNCEGMALPWDANFSVALSNCWTVHYQNTSYIPSANTFSQDLQMNGGKNGASNNVVVLPAFATSLTDAMMTFEYRGSTGSQYAQLEAGYVTDKADTTTFVALETLDQAGTYTEARVALATVPTDAYLAFRYAGASSHGDLYIKNLRVANTAVFADADNNTATLAGLNGQTLDVVIGRTITRTGYFNTICLPFDMPTLVGTPLEGAELWAFKYAKVENEELLFRIVEASSIEAGVPYFIQFAAGDAIVNPLFKNVTIAASVGQKVGDENMAQLCGILQPEIFTPGDQTKLFLYNENALYWWNGASASALNSFRAYFKVVTTGASAPARHNMPARLIKEEQQATGMESVQPSVISSQKILENGQVIIIRNGVKYSVQGQVIR